MKMRNGDSFYLSMSDFKQVGSLLFDKIGATVPEVTFVDGNLYYPNYLVVFYNPKKCKEFYDIFTELLAVQFTAEELKAIERDALL